jgi:magnesium-transporting ATPase (P-type)
LDTALPNVSEDSPQYRSIFESDLIYLGTFGLIDNLRPNIQKTINMLQYGVEEPEPKTPKAVTVRIVSGDHIETAK